MKTFFILTLITTSSLYMIILLILYSLKISWGVISTICGFFGPFFYAKELWSNYRILTVGYCISLSLFISSLILGKVTGIELI